MNVEAPKPEPLADEQLVRGLRNLVFGSQIEDGAWACCGPNWMKPAEASWLLAHATILQLTKKKNSA